LWVLRARARGYRRREFVTLLGGAAAWPLALRAEQAGKLPTIGYLGVTTPVVSAQRTAAFIQRLRELGWIDGRNLAVEYRWAEGSDERTAEFVAEFVRRKVDIIVTWATAPAFAAKRATTTIPIVLALKGRPVAQQQQVQPKDDDKKE
jgi:putative ABC transport system substrate-binding protein